MRESYLERKTGEVDIEVYVNLDRARDLSVVSFHYEPENKEIFLKPAIEMTSKFMAETGDWFGYLPHWWDQVPIHGNFDIRVKANGDNDHHVYEDTAILLGRATRNAVGDKKGIKRNGYGSWNFEGNIGKVTVDLSGRGYYGFKGNLYDKKLSQMIHHTFMAFARESGIDMYVEVESANEIPENDHHKAESIFKALAKALDGATEVHPRSLGEAPSSKGKLD